MTINYPHTPTKSEFYPRNWTKIYITLLEVRSCMYLVQKNIVRFTQQIL